MELVTIYLLALVIFLLVLLLLLLELNQIASISSNLMEEVMIDSPCQKDEFQTTSISSNLMEEVMTDSPCQKDEFLSIAIVGIGNQTVGISSSLMEEVMIEGPCQNLDEFPSILNLQNLQSKDVMFEEGWTPVTRKGSKKALPQFDMNLRFHKKGVKWKS